ncbi:major facilitator superfamily domain-containing protein [Hypoxylon crocopeplum]|nr:major facilitator superfamily domain-containing protein [Hypoxylon crocopeplum]
MKQAYFRLRPWIVQPSSILVLFRHRPLNDTCLLTMADIEVSNGPTEETPLCENQSKPHTTQTTADHLNYRDKNIIFSLLVYFFHQMYDFLPVTPFLLLFERSICFRYYAIHDPAMIGPDGIVDEKYCKIEPVQHSLAVFRGWKPVFGAIPVFLLAIPYGRIADKYGKKRVASLSLIGLTLGEIWTIFIVSWPSIFPIEVAWSQSLFSFIGGGDSQAASMIYLIGSDLVEEHQKSKLFYLMYCVYLGTELIGPIISAATMDISPYIPIALTLASIMIALGILQLIDERKPSRGRDHNPEQMFQPPESAVNHDSSIRTQAAPSSGATSRSDSLAMLLRQKNILLILAVFLTPYLRPATMFILQQYASVRFDWKISRTSLLTSEAAIVNIILFLFIIPQVTSMIRARFDVRQETIDLSVAQISLALLTGGSLLIGLSPNSNLMVASVAIFTAGFGVRVALIASAASLADQTIRARLFATLQIMENIGMLSGFPLTQSMLATALRIGPPWLGFPFLIISGIFGTALVCTLFIHSGQG